MPSVSSIASPEPQLFTIDDDSNEPTMPYGFGRQLPIVPLSLNDLKLPPNPFNILNTMAVVTQRHHDNDGYSPQSPKPSNPSPISTSPMNVSTFNSWETPHTTTDDNTFYSPHKPRRVYWTSPPDEEFDSEDEPRRIYVLSKFITAAYTQDEEENRDRDVFSGKKGSVAARLRTLRSDDPLSKGYPRSVEQELETFQTHIKTIKLTNLSI